MDQVPAVLDKVNRAVADLETATTEFDWLGRTLTARHLIERFEDRYRLVWLGQRLRLLKWVQILDSSRQLCIELRKCGVGDRVKDLAVAAHRIHVDYADDAHGWSGSLGARVVEIFTDEHDQKRVRADLRFLQTLAGMLHYRVTFIARHNANGAALALDADDYVALRNTPYPSRYDPVPNRKRRYLGGTP